jgi:crotonobetainyl-CoA:carnitine CoA-transferase CaiB-like acyl-CoA transferase
MDNKQSCGPLQGVRILDLTQMLAGPLCTMRLGDLGADVLKIEPFGTGEWTRTHGFANAELSGHTTAYLGLNRNKRSVVLDLKNADGVETFMKLAERADIIVQNFRVGTVERLGVGYDAVSKVNPRIIYGYISGYGEDGPYKDRPGQDLAIQGYSGSMWSVGSKGDPPIPSAMWAADAMTGYQMLGGLLAALWSREKSGRGQKVSVSMLGVVMDCQSQELVTAFNLGIIPERSERPFAHAWVTAPYGSYRTKDGWINLSQVPLDKLGVAVDDERLRAMTKWSDGMDRRDEVYDILTEILPRKTTAEWMEILERHKLWYSPVYNYLDLMNDPHVKATNMIATVEHAEAGTLKMANVPVTMSETPGSIRTPPPLLGEHTAEALRDWLEYSDATIARLEKANAIQGKRTTVVEAR